MEEAIVNFLNLIKAELKQNSRQIKTIKVKTILSRLGYQRRSQILIDNFNRCLADLELRINPSFSMYLDYEQTVTIFLDKVASSEINDKNSIKASNAPDLFETLQVKHDFFYYLFDFGSEQEYERFQASLDFSKPVGLFLVPAKNDFFSEVVTKILTYEAIKKKQYKGLTTHLVTSTAEFDSTAYSNEYYETTTGERQPTLSYATIVNFNQSKMANLILGDTSIDLIDSERFDEEFEQLSLYANKYYSDQFFILFHCPSETEMHARQKEDMLNYWVDRITKKLPYVFTLRCKYSDDTALPADIRENIQAHFRFLLEAPKYTPKEDDLSIIDYFINLQKIQSQSESQLLLKMKPKHFRKLVYGFESDEHIYLKYFAVKTLEQQGYHLSQIKCEATVNSDINDSNSVEVPSKIVRRPDVYVENKVIVEIETLRGKTSGDNVFIDLIHDILVKMEGWSSKTGKIWLVFPGFEIARNYYQLKKLKRY